jgi:hypothetical protein
MPKNESLAHARTAVVASSLTAALFLLAGAYAGPRDLKVTGLTVVNEEGYPIARLGVEDVVFGDGRRQESVGLFLHPMATADGAEFYFYDGAAIRGEDPNQVFVPHPFARMPYLRNVIKESVEFGNAASPDDVLVPTHGALLAPLHPESSFTRARADPSSEDPS